MQQFYKLTVQADKTLVMSMFFAKKSLAERFAYAVNEVMEKNYKDSKKKPVFEYSGEICDLIENEKDVIDMLTKMFEQLNKNK